MNAFQTALAPKQMMRIELDIFSGRPNPSWVADADASEAMERWLNLLPPADTWVAAPAAADELGYRGFILLREDDAGTPPTRLRVFRGRVFDEHRSCNEPAGFEPWLIEQAANQGWTDAVRHLV